MDYPYPPLVPLLQFHRTPDEYRRLKALYLSSLVGGTKYPSPVDEYWRIVPHHTYAYCPICRTQYREPADTHELRGWGPSQDLLQVLYGVPGEYPTNSPCPHFLGIHAFLNLHGNLPSEITYLENSTGEVPYLTPWFFPGDIESYAVLHALPICRIEADQFVPRYTVFSLTYFNQDPKLVLKRHYAVEAERGKNDPEYDAATVYPPGAIYTGREDETLYDLPSWAARGLLGWLDFTQANTPLQIGVGSKLPEIYQQIQGSRKTYVWRKGRIHPF
ncbi:MAG: hypothetical protein ACT4QE_18875 [Anaerolineales bacterium]